MNYVEIVGVRTFLTFECRCCPHYALQTAHHSAGVLKSRIKHGNYASINMNEVIFY